MPIELEEYYEELLQEIYSSADADGAFVEDAFFETWCEHLVDVGELDTADRAHFVSQQRGLRVDGYGGDPLLAEGVLNLIVADFNQSPDIGTLTATEMNSVFKRTESFVQRSLNESFRSELEDTSPAFGLADLIAARWEQISKIRLFLISNRRLSTRVDGRPAGELQGMPTTYSVWDIGRLHRYAVAGGAKEDIEIDLEGEYGGALRVLPANHEQATYESYLAMVPGRQLADIYDHWGARLLEQNVRVFLQARGNVNRGIRNTLENDPEMFFAYNNGITATAERIETKKSDQGLLITKLENFQIVNGGQTTASIHAASKKKEVDLSKVFVQMKLSIVEPSRVLDVVPKISEFANTQNRVNAADFFANHPFHIRMEQFSRRIYAPSPDGAFRQSKWFYERARGQYQDARGQLSQSDRKKFDLEYPKKQVFTKTDLAKFHNSWLGLPHEVSKGAQKNFALFARTIGREWTRQADEFNESFFHDTVARAIIFQEVEKLVSQQSWYQGGYRANIVAYAIAKLGRDIADGGEALNFDRIWRDQTLSPGLREVFTMAAAAVNDVIVDSPSTMRNVTEWAKQQACWSRVESLSIEWPSALNGELMTKQEQKEEKRFAVKDQKVLNGIQAQLAVTSAAPGVWAAVIEWGNSKGLLTPTEADILGVAAAVPDRIPTEIQSQRAIETLKRLQKEGCQLELDTD